MAATGERSARRSSHDTRTAAACLLLLAVTAVLSGGCKAAGGNPMAPTSLAPAPAAIVLKGSVGSSVLSIAVPGALVEILDGANAGRATVTGSLGEFQLGDLATSERFSIRVSLAGYRTSIFGVDGLTTSTKLSVFNLPRL